MEATIDRRIDAHIARTQLSQIIDRATRNNDRFIVNRRGAPTIVILSVKDFIRIMAPPTNWLETARSGTKHRGLDRLTSSGE